MEFSRSGMPRVLLLLLPPLLLLTCAACESALFRDFHLVKEPKSWADAQSACRELHLDLATVESAVQSERLLSRLRDSGPADPFAWIGLRDDATRWSWTLRDEEFVQGRDYSNWQDGEPNERSLSRSCVAVRISGVWWDQQCEEENPSVCYDQQDPSKFVLVQTLLSWAQARDNCRSLHTDLAVVRNASENDRIYPPLPRRSWIGLHRFPWSRWSDRTAVNFTDWQVGQPPAADETPALCALADTSTGKWHSAPCGDVHDFVCQSMVPPRARLELRFRSEADPNGPETERDILQQLHGKLEGRGLSGVRLRWMQTDGQTFHKEKKKRG